MQVALCSMLQEVLIKNIIKCGCIEVLGPQIQGS